MQVFKSHCDVTRSQVGDHVHPARPQVDLGLGGRLGRLGECVGARKLGTPPLRKVLRVPLLRHLVVVEVVVRGGLGRLDGGPRRHRIRPAQPPPLRRLDHGLGVGGGEKRLVVAVYLLHFQVVLRRLVVLGGARRVGR